MLLFNSEMCGRPGSPQNGVLAYENDFAVGYTCDEGFALWDGDKTRKCVNGSWTVADLANIARSLLLGNLNISRSRSRDLRENH